MRRGEESPGFVIMQILRNGARGGISMCVCEGTGEERYKDKKKGRVEELRGFQER